MLQIRDVHTAYGPVHVLRGVSLDVQAGQTVALLGRNGVGKTTLAYSLMGVVRPHAGSIAFDGTELRGLAPHVIAQRGIGLVPQGRRIFGSLTVLENLTLGARGAHIGEPQWHLERVLDLFPILRERHAQFANTLSGGEQQMLACARALMANPRLLVMDEPSEGLAPQKLRELGALLDQLRASGIAILLIEQNMRFALRYCDDVCAIDDGRIGFAGTPHALLRDTEAQERLLGVGSTRSASFTSSAIA
jgi:branched-chain amino acid transport system ATP-binding protein